MVYYWYRAYVMPKKPSTSGKGNLRAHFVHWQQRAAAVHPTQAGAWAAPAAVAPEPDGLATDRRAGQGPQGAGSATGSGAPTARGRGGDRGRDDGLVAALLLSRDSFRDGAGAGGDRRSSAAAGAPPAAVRIRRGGDEKQGRDQTSEWAVMDADGAYAAASGRRADRWENPHRGAAAGGWGDDPDVGPKAEAASGPGPSDRLVEAAVRFGRRMSEMTRRYSMAAGAAPGEMIGKRPGRPSESLATQGMPSATRTAPLPAAVGPSIRTLANPGGSLNFGSFADDSGAAPQPQPSTPGLVERFQTWLRGRVAFSLDIDAGGFPRGDGATWVSRADAAHRSGEQQIAGLGFSCRAHVYIFLR